MFMKIAISGERNVIKKEAEKILKYKDLTIEVRRMWNVNTKLKPVIIETTRTISKSFQKYLRNIPEADKKLQKQPYLALHTYVRKY